MITWCFEHHACTRQERDSLWHESPSDSPYNQQASTPSQPAMHQHSASPAASNAEGQHAVRCSCGGCAQHTKDVITGEIEEEPVNLWFTVLFQDLQQVHDSRRRYTLSLAHHCRQDRTGHHPQGRTAIACPTETACAADVRSVRAEDE